jgi:hypothetical protein
MTLSAFFDESIRDRQGNEPISVAGYVFKPKAYMAFARDWKRMLVSGPMPTTHFHMTNLYARDYEYTGWSPEERAALLQRAVDAVRRYSHFGVSVMLSQADFAKYAPEGWAARHGSIYSAACQMALRATAYWMDHNRCDARIAYVFESGHRFWPEADALLRATGGHPALKRLYYYKTHFSRDKCDSYGLQAADMLAWIMTRGAVGVPNNQTMTAFRPIIRSLVAGQLPRKYQLFHAHDDVNKLCQFFKQQAAAPPQVFADHPRGYKPALR